METGKNACFAISPRELDPAAALLVEPECLSFRYTKRRDEARRGTELPRVEERGVSILASFLLSGSRAGSVSHATKLFHRTWMRFSYSDGRLQ